MYSGSSCSLTGVGARSIRKLGESAEKLLDLREWDRGGKRGATPGRGKSSSSSSCSSAIEACLAVETDPFLPLGFVDLVFDLVDGGEDIDEPSCLLLVLVTGDVNGGMVD